MNVGTLFYMALAWLFILAEYAMRAYTFVRTMNAAPTGRHAGGRHLAAVIDLETRYVPVRVEGATSHRRRQGWLTMPARVAA